MEKIHLLNTRRLIYCPTNWTIRKKDCKMGLEPITYKGIIVAENAYNAIEWI